MRGDSCSSLFKYFPCLTKVRQINVSYFYTGNLCYQSSRSNWRFILKRDHFAVRRGTSHLTADSHFIYTSNRKNFLDGIEQLFSYKKQMIHHRSFDTCNTVQRQNRHILNDFPFKKVFFSSFFLEDKFVLVDCAFFYKKCSQCRVSMAFQASRKRLLSFSLSRCFRASRVSPRRQGSAKQPRVPKEVHNDVHIKRKLLRFTFSCPTPFSLLFTVSA